jgi:hypothetical protein
MFTFSLIEMRLCGHHESILVNLTPELLPTTIGRERLRKEIIAATPFSFHLIPELHKRCFISVLQAASVTPDPIGKLTNRRLIETPIQNQ